MSVPSAVGAAGPLSLRAILGDCAWVLRRAWRALEGLTALAALPLWLVAWCTGEAATLGGGAPVPVGGGAFVEARRALLAGDLGPVAAALGLQPWVFLTGLLVYPLIGGAQVLLVAQARCGDEPQLGAALRGAWQRYPALVRASALVAAAGLSVGVGFVWRAGGRAGPDVLALAVAVVVMAGGATWVGLYPQAIVLEGAGAWGAARRSVHLVRGQFWSVLSAGLALGLLGAIVQTLLRGVARMLGAAPGDWLYTGLEELGGALSWALTAVVGTVVYFRLREEEEGGGAEAWRTAEAE